MWKSCDVGEYLDYESGKCRKKIVDKLVEEYSEEIDVNEIIYNDTLNDYGKVCIISHIFNDKHKH